MLPPDEEAMAQIGAVTYSCVSAKLANEPRKMT